MLATKKYVKNEIKALRGSIENDFPSDDQMNGVISRLENVEKQVNPPKGEIEYVTRWTLSTGWEENRSLRQRIRDNEDSIVKLNNRIKKLMDKLGYCEVVTETKIEIKPCKKVKK